MLKTTKLNNPHGESPEVLLKAYKWIWGQEDCNYPEGKGRTMSWEGWRKEKGLWVKTGDGIIDLRNMLRAISEGQQKSPKLINMGAERNE